MAKLGRTNHLIVTKVVDFGIYLDGDELGEILLPKRYVPENSQVGDTIEVFVYVDSEDRYITTTEFPLAQVDQCAHLRVVEVNAVGAFLDWGLPKDLLLPFKEQTHKLEAGDHCVVFIFIDSNTQRIAASQYLNDFLEETGNEFSQGEEVDLLVSGQSPLGYKVVVNNTDLGLIYANEISQNVHVGQSLKGYVKPPRPDGKLDISLNTLNSKARDELADKIVQHLHANGGSSPLNDKSSPQDIYRVFAVSKANFKKSIGGLYKSKKIRIEKSGIHLI
ncbi:MAG: CvfB family protein [Oceanococcus sp.]